MCLGFAALLSPLLKKQSNQKIATEDSKDISYFMNERLEKEGKRLWKQTLRWVSLPIGVVLFAVGAVLFPLPIPLGAILMVLGLFVAAFNPLVLRRLRRIRKRFPKASAKIRAITPHMPGFLRKFLNRTDLDKRGQKEN